MSSNQEEQIPETAGVKKRSRPEGKLEQDSIAQNLSRRTLPFFVAPHPVAKRSRVDSANQDQESETATGTASVEQQVLVQASAQQQLLGTQQRRQHAASVLGTTQGFILQSDPEARAQDSLGLSRPDGTIGFQQKPQESRMLIERAFLASRNDLSNPAQFNQMLHSYTVAQPFGANNLGIGTMNPMVGQVPFRMPTNAGSLGVPLDSWLSAAAAAVVINQPPPLALLNQQAALSQFAVSPYQPATNVSISPAAGLLGRESVVPSSQACCSIKNQIRIPRALPVILFLPEDNLKLSPHQVLLRQQIEAFEAVEDDVSSHMRGRNKPIAFGQVGIRCLHCAHLPVVRRQKGSTYFPSSTLGLYQAAQNMSSSHMQNGSCTEMPQEIKRQFVALMMVKSTSSGAGRPYWAQAAKKLGLVDTDDAGIRFVLDMPKKSPTPTPPEA